MSPIMYKNKIALFLLCIFLVVHSSCNNDKTSTEKDTVETTDSSNNGRENLTADEKI